ncbi:MAG: AraC family transcriptional regulator [Allosphingosinicella sp.]
MSSKRHTPADEPFLILRTLASNHPEGDEIRPHAHGWHQLIYAASGVLTVWTERGTWTVPPSWAVWVPAGIRHAIRFAAASALRTLYLQPVWAEGLPADCTAVTVSPLLRELILRAVRDGMLDRRETADLALAILIADEFRRSGAPPFELPQPRSEKVRQATALAAGGQGDTGTAELARVAGLGRRTLERRFRAETGMSPAGWRRHARLLAAIERLAAGEAVKSVAAAAGYASPSAFVAAFRRQFGVTPGRYFDRG